MRGQQTLGFILIGALLRVAPPARACVGDQYDSIHFNSGSPDFGTPPRRAIMEWLGERDDRPLTRHDYSGGGRTGVELTDNRDERQAAQQHLLQQQVGLAQRYAATSNWAKAQQVYTRLAQRFPTRGSLRDRVEVLRQVAALPQPLAPGLAHAVVFYLRSLALDDSTPETTEPVDAAYIAFQHLYNTRIPQGDLLREHALYQMAALTYEANDYAGAVRLYQKFGHEFPHSVKTEAALIMLARCALLPHDLKNQQLAVGHTALETLQRDFPHSRFRNAITGLRGRLYYLTKNYPAALNCYLAVGDLPSVEIIRQAAPALLNNGLRPRLFEGYLRRLAVAPDYESYTYAVQGLEHTRAALKPAEAQQLARALFQHADLFAPYFYYRLYICVNTPKDLLNLAHLADTLAQRQSATLSPLVRVRLAEVYYQHGDYAKALRWIGPASQSQDIDRALYVRGATLHKLGRYRPATANFITLLSRYPQSPLKRSAHEELALVYEALHDNGHALEQYAALGYDADVAFLLDIRMMPDEIRNFIQTRPHYPQRALCAYSLGIRYLREEKWQPAAFWLHQVDRAQYQKFQKPSGESEFDTTATRPDALTTVRQLSSLQRAVASAAAPNARAAALYRYASYYYKGSSLMLYNPALWHYDRVSNFAFWWNTPLATPADVAAVRAHMYSHEVYAHALQLCQLIAQRYPNSPQAPVALYRAACAARKLANFNQWWRDDSAQHNHWLQASHLMQEMAHRYPHHPLAPHARKYAKVFAGEQSQS